MTDAALGYGSTYEIFYNSSFVEVGEVINITPGELVAAQVDATHMKSPGRRRESIAGLIDVGQGSFDINWVPGNSTDEMLRALLASGARSSHRITFSNGERVTFTGAVSGFSKALPIDDRMTATVNFLVSGDEVWDSV